MLLGRIKLLTRSCFVANEGAQKLGRGSDHQPGQENRDMSSVALSKMKVHCVMSIRQSIQRKSQIAVRMVHSVLTYSAQLIMFGILYCSQLSIALSRDKTNSQARCDLIVRRRASPSLSKATITASQASLKAVFNHIMEESESASESSHQPRRTYRELQKPYQRRIISRLKS
jgi:hypothetical protein